MHMTSSWKHSTFFFLSLTAVFSLVGWIDSPSPSSSSCPAEMVPTGTGACIDRNEWRDSKTGKPLIGMSGLPEVETKEDVSLDTFCRSVGKRVCTRKEWMRACSGGERYPYGNEYEPGACNDSRWWKTVDETRVAHRDPKELERLDGSEPPGSRPECRSPSGAMDMVGNAEEWVLCPEGKFGWCLVGGYWASRGSKSCESAILTHSPRWHYYQTSGRCCTSGSKENQ